MLRLHLTLAFRTLLRNPLHTTIHIVGLSIGVAACLVIYLIVRHELSFNRSIADYDRIYRIHSQFSGTFSGLNRGVPTAVGPYVSENFKGIESAALFFVFASKVEVPDTSEIRSLGRQEGVVIAGAEFFNVFGQYEWLQGSPNELNDPSRVVLTSSQARKYFGDLEDVVGKEVIYRDSLVTHVAGVVADLPFQTDIFFTDFISFPTVEASWLKKNYPLDDWASTNSSTQLFVKIAPGFTQDELVGQVPALTKIYDEKSGWDATNTFNVQPLSDLHFNPETGIFDSGRDSAHLPTLLALVGVAFLLLLMASVNFVNLSTAQGIRRAREVGVRKVLGSSRQRLIIQFISEGVLLTLIALVIALPLARLALWTFTDFIPEGFVMHIADLLPFAAFMILSLGLMAGAYPAFVLSSFLPALVLKAQTTAGIALGGPSLLRKVLIVLQFGFAQALILASIVVATQIRFMLDRDLGFRQEAVIYFETPWWEENNRTSALKSELENLPFVTEIALSAAPPAYPGWSSSSVKFQGGQQPLSLSVYRKFCDTSYLQFYGIKLLAGRNLTHSDTVKEFLINETLVKTFGFARPEDALGAEMEYGSRKIPIVGVVKDFHFQSLHHKVEPVMMANEAKEFTCLNVRLQTTDRTSTEEALDAIKKTWKGYYPDVPFEHHFLDETVASFYRTEKRTSKLAVTAMGLAILISCLGLFGLASYTTGQRTKEIGIRKVLGASANQIVVLLSRNFLALVFLAFVLAAPVAWLLVNRWLDTYYYRTDPKLWMFVATAVTAVLTALLSVGYQTLRVAGHNPADSLKNE